MIPEEKKRIQRALLIRLGVLIGIKVGITYILHRWSKSLADEMTDPSKPIDDMWYANTYTVKKGTEIVHGFIPSNFLEK